MEHKQCLVCGITDGILDGIIKCVLLDNQIEICDCPDGIDNILNVINDHVSYVIVGNDKKQLPVEYKELLNNNNELIVIELLNNGKSLGLYVDDISEIVLNKIINLKVR